MAGTGTGDRDEFFGDEDLLDYLAVLNGTVGQHSKLQQKLGVQGMHLFFYIRDVGSLSLAASLTQHEIKHLTNVHTCTIIRWFKFYQQYGELPLEYAEKYSRNHRSKEAKSADSIITNDMWRALVRRLDEDPTLYLDEMKDFFEDEFNAKVSISAISKRLKKENYSNKKIYTKACQAIEALKSMFIANMRSVLKTPEMALFIDETQKDRKAARRKRGWSLQGIEIVFNEPFNTDIRYTMIGAADCYGFVPHMCETIMHEVHGKIESDPVDGVRFVQYFREYIYPLLGNAANRERHSVVIMDNCTIHNMPEILAMIREKGAILLHSAPYAPDLIPIEFMFKAYKDHLNRHSRDFKKFWDIVHNDALHCISPQEGLHYFTKTTLTELVEGHELLQDDELKVAGALVATFMCLYDDEIF
jgi:transposase